MTINTIAEALKNLYAKLGGTDNVADVPTVAEMIDKVTEVAGTGGGGLPDVTSADNGKVLSVVNGAWAANNPFDVIFKVSIVEGDWADIETIGFDENDFFYKIEHNKPINIYIESVNEANYHQTWLTRLLWTEGEGDWTVIAMYPYVNNGAWVFETHDIILVYEDGHYIWVLD